MPRWRRSEAPAPATSTFDASAPKAPKTSVEGKTAGEMENAIEAQHPVQPDLMQNKIEDEASLILSYVDSVKVGSKTIL
jgi:hypothetical protein